MQEPFPPNGFVPAPSAIDGIEIYVPAPPSPEDHREIVDFKCPQCAATTAFSVADGGLTCTHCGHYEPPTHGTVGKAAEEFEFTVETMQRVARGWGHAREEICCQNCGAQTSAPPDTLAFACPFCGSNKVIQREPPQDQLRPRFLIPFEIEAEECQRIALDWLGRSWMTPGSLRKFAQFGGFAPIYLPYWTFDADIAADWQAEVAHSRTERHFSGGKWTTRTVTEWRWESGHVQLNVDDLLVRGSAHLSPLLLGRIERFDLAALAAYEPGYLAGLSAQAYVVPLDAAWATGQSAMRERAREACRQQASGQRILNLSVSLDFSNEAWRYILLPVYIAAYRFAGRTYQVLVNGQMGVIAGQRPVSWRKVGLASVALVTPGLLVCITGAIVLTFDERGVLLGLIGTVVLLIAAVIAIRWALEAARLDDA